MSLALTNTLASPLAAFARKQAEIARVDRQGAAETAPPQTPASASSWVDVAISEQARQALEAGAQSTPSTQSDTWDTISSVVDRFFERAGSKDAERANASGNVVATDDDTKTPAETRFEKTLEIAGREKARAKEMIVELGKQLKLLREIYATNPKEMVKQYTRILKQLKDAIAIYAKAASQVRDAARELKKSVSDAGAAPAVTAGPPPTAATGQAEDAAPASDDAAAETDSAPADTSGAAEADDAASQSGALAGEDRTRAVEAYQKVEVERYRTDDTPEGRIAHEDREFIRQVRGFMEKFKEFVHETRVKAIGFYGSSFLKSDTYKDMEKAMKEVEEDLGDLDDVTEEFAPATVWAYRVVA